MLRKVFLLALTLLLPAAGALSKPCPTVSAETGHAIEAVPVTLSESQAEDLYLIHGSFDTPEAPDAVWRVLSDYPSLVGILDGMKSSRVLERKGNEALLEQVMQGHFLIFGKTLTLRLRVMEHPPRLIEFSLADPKTFHSFQGAPFRVYQGSWTITSQTSGCRVDYSLQVSRGDLAPRFLERHMFRQNAETLLKELGREVARRAAASKKIVK